MMKLSPVAPVALALALPLALAACNKAPETGATAAAGGEVLPGSVSDAMIDLDGATGTAPLQPAPRVKPSERAVASDAAPASEAAAPAAAAPADTTSAAPPQ